MLKTYQRGIHVFKLLENTGNALSLGNLANTLAFRWSEAKNAEPIKVMQDQIDYFTLASRRHPDPETVYKQEVVCPDLQIRGAWKKIAIQSKAKPLARHAFTSWVWGGRMYVLNGNGPSGQHDDMW